MSRKIKYYNPPKPVYVEWLDAHAYSSGWYDEQEIKDISKESRIVVRHLGWLYAEDSSMIMIFSRYTKFNDGEKQYGHLQKIPKTWIKRKKFLRI